MEKSRKIRLSAQGTSDKLYLNFFRHQESGELFWRDELYCF